MLKTFRFMLLAAFMMVCSSLFAQEETTVTWEAASGDPLSTIYPDANISLMWEEGGGEFSPKYSNGSVLFYNGNRLTVAGTSTDVTIKKIMFTFSSDKVSMVTCDASGKNESTVGITNSTANMTSTWEGGANKLIFRAPKQTNNRSISSIEVTYTGGTTGPVETAPELAITQANIADTFDMDANGVFVVYYENKGNAAAENAKLTLYVDGTENASKTIGTLAIGASSFWNAKYDVTSIEAGEHTVKLALTADNADAAEVEKTVTFTKKAPEATFSISASNVTVAYDATSFNVVALLKNTSNVDATDVKVELRKGFSEVLADATVASLTANEETNVTLTVEGGPFDAGTKTYYLYVNGTYLAPVEVTVEEAPEVETKDLAITEILGTIELANTTNNVRVSVVNNGNVDITDAVVTLKTGETVLGNATVSATKNGGTGFCTIAVASEGLTAGELDVTATVVVEGDATPDDNTMTATLTVNEVPAPEAAFEVTVNDVEVLTTDATVKVVVNVKNTSEVKADQVEVKLLRGMDQKGESKIIFGLEGGADQNVTIEFDNYESAGTYEMQAWAGKQATYFNVVVKEPEVDLAIEAIQGTIDLSASQSTVSVTVNNIGTADVTEAPVTLTTGETVLGTATVSVKAGQTGYAYVQVASEGLQAGELDVIATVEAENDINSANNSKTATLTVNAASEAEPVFSVTAANVVTVPFGATSFDIVATVKNISEVNAQNVEVKLLNGINPVETKTIETLAAGEEATVTFTITEIGDPGATATYYVQAGDDQKDVAVKFEKEPVTEVADLAIEAIQGTIDLSATQSNVSVTVKNKGNVDVKNAKVTLSYGETTLEKTIASIKAGEQGYAYFQVASEGITGETLSVTAAVELESDATPDDNTMTAKLTVKAAPVAEAVLVLTAQNVEANYGEDINFTVNVKNNSEVEAKDVTVEILSGTTLIARSALSYDIEPGQSVDVPFTIEKEMQIPVGTIELHAIAGKYDCFFNVTVKEVVEPVVDMALTQIQGVTEINLKAENKVMVWYKNEGNVATTATITAYLNGWPIETKEVENIKADAQGYVTFTLSTEGMTAGETVAFEAVISASEDNNDTNNAVSMDLPIVSGEVEPAAVIALNPVSSYEVEAAGEQEISVNVGVFNNGDADAENVEIKVYQAFGTDLATQTVNIEKGGSALVTLKFNYDIQKATEFHVAAYYNNVLATDVQDFTVSIKEVLPDVTIAKIADINVTTEDEVVIAATLKNNSDIVAENVLVALYQGTEQVEGTVVKKVNEIAANGEAQVEFNLGKLTAGTYSYNVMITSKDANADNNMQSVSVKVTEYEAPVVNVALTAIQGISNIDLAEGANNTISVWVANTGNVDADATVAVTLNGTAVGEAQTVAVKAGKNAYASFTLPTEGLVAGEKATVVATVTVEGNTAETTTETKEYDIVNSAVATEPVFAVTAENVTVEYGATSFEIKATVKNTSTIDAQNVVVNLFNNTVVATQTIETLAAGAEAEVVFTIEATDEAPFVAGKTATYYVQAPKAQAEVTVTFEEEPVAPVVNVALTAIQGISNIDLAEDANNTISVWVANEGTVDADATVAVTLNGTAVGEAQTVAVKAGKNAYASFTLPTEGLVAGEKATVVATVTVEGNTAETTTETKEYDIVNSAVATEPVFAVTADNVTVEYGATSFEIKATVKNTSTIDAQNVEVKLFNNTVVATQTIASLTAGAETEVTFTVEATDEAPFVAGRTATYYVQAPKAQAEVTVTFAEAPVEQKVDLVVTSISGTLSIENETNSLIVWVSNNGTVDVENAVVTLTAGEKVLGTGTVSAKAGSENNRCTITVAAADLTVGEFEVTATVTAENDVDETNNSFSHTYTIAAPAAVLSFTVADVTAKVDAASFEVKVTVANTGMGDAENVAVKVYDKNSAELAAATIATVAAGTEETVTITIDKTYAEAGTLKNELQVWVAGVEGVKWVNVTVENITDGIAAIKAQFGENVQIFNLAGKKVNDVRKGEVYIINGKKTVIK